MKYINYLLFFSLLLLFNACAFTPQKASLSPSIHVTERNIGNGVSVSVAVVDERSDSTLGHRGGGFGKGAKITTDQNVADVVMGSIVEGLKRKGFNANPTQGDSQRALKVEIRLIEYSTSAGMFTGGVHTKTTLKTIANNDGKFYENFYRVENEHRVAVVPSADVNERWINEALSEAIQKLLDDTELISHLAK